MNINCRKCNNPLTKRSLRPSKNWVVVNRTIEVIEDGGDPFEYEAVELGIKTGSFIIERDTMWVEPEDNYNYLINPVDIKDGIVPEFKSGGGCCNWFMQDLHCPSCGSLVGVANLDCYQAKNISFAESKVVRCYKRRVG